MTSTLVKQASLSQILIALLIVLPLIPIVFVGRLLNDVLQVILFVVGLKTLKSNS